jgi:hypothetical protein
LEYGWLRRNRRLRTVLEQFNNGMYRAATAGRKIVALRNADVDTWALLAGDDDTVLCPRPECRHRNMLITRTGTDLN